MKKMKHLFTTILTLALVFGMTVPAHAASSNVNIEIQSTTMDNVSVTVPTNLPIVFNADGTNTLPTNWTIENRSTIAGIHLSEIQMNAGTNGWKLLDASEDTKQLAVNSKSIQFFVGKQGALKLVAPSEGRSAASGSVTFGVNEIAIASGETQVLSFNVKRGAFTNAEASAKAFDMILTFEFN